MIVYLILQLKVFQVNNIDESVKYKDFIKVNSYIFEKYWILPLFLQSQQQLLRNPTHPAIIYRTTGHVAKQLWRENVRSRGGNGNARLLVDDAAETSGQTKDAKNWCSCVKRRVKKVEKLGTNVERHAKNVNKSFKLRVLR